MTEINWDEVRFAIGPEATRDALGLTADEFNIGLWSEVSHLTAEVRGLREQADDARANALHEVAAKIETYLRQEHAAPIWWHLYDIVHRAAGCTWDDEAGEDGFGEYDCATSMRSGRAADEWKTAADNNWHMLQDETRRADDDEDDDE